MYRTLYTKEGLVSEIILDDEQDQDILFWQI